MSHHFDSPRIISKVSFFALHLRENIKKHVFFTFSWVNTFACFSLDSHFSSLIIFFDFFREKVKNGSKKWCHERGRGQEANGEGGARKVEGVGRCRRRSGFYRSFFFCWKFLSFSNFFYNNVIILHNVINAIMTSSIVKSLSSRVEWRRSGAQRRVESLRWATSRKWQKSLCWFLVNYARKNPIFNLITHISAQTAQIFEGALWQSERSSWKTR